MDRTKTTHQSRAVRRVYKSTDAGAYDPENLVRDILTDLRHFCDRKGLSFASEDQVAYANYMAERVDDQRKKVMP